MLKNKSALNGLIVAALALLAASAQAQAPVGTTNDASGMHPNAPPAHQIQGNPADPIIEV